MPWNNYQRFRVAFLKKHLPMQILLENSVNHFKMTQNIFVCTTEFSLKDNIKICCDCFKIYHYKCILN